MTNLRPTYEHQRLLSQMRKIYSLVEKKRKVLETIINNDSKQAKTCVQDYVNVSYFSYGIHVCQTV